MLNVSKIREDRDPYLETIQDGTIWYLGSGSEEDARIKLTCREETLFSVHQNWHGRSVFQRDFVFFQIDSKKGILYQKSGIFLSMTKFDNITKRRTKTVGKVLWVKMT